MKRLFIFMLCTILLIGCSAVNENDKKQSKKNTEKAIQKEDEKHSKEKFKEHKNNKGSKDNKKTEDAEYKIKIDNYTSLLDYHYDGENIMISGLSLDFVLGLIANGSNNTTSNNIADFLGNDIDVLNNFSSFYLDSNEKVRITNNAYIKNEVDLEINEEYRNILNKYYNADINIEDFNNGTVDIINSWVNNSTDGFIRKITDDVSEYEAMLINVIYFKDSWKKQIDERNIISEKFTLFDGSEKLVDMMNFHDGRYYENDYAIGFSKEYENDGIIFIGILPKAEGEFNVAGLDIESLIESGRYVDNLYVKLPKFEFENELKLNNYLKDNGLKNIFSSGLTGIVNRELAVDIIKQNTRIRVDEEGTEAAAVTSAAIKNTAMGVEKNYYVYLNRPFVFVIYDEINEVPLFIGKVVDPAE